MHEQSEPTRQSLDYVPGDFGDRCVNNFGVAQTIYETNQRTYRTWCVDVMDWTTASDNTNVTLLQKGLLGAYMAKAVGSYKCPADKGIAPAQLQAGMNSRVRSYSMNDFVGLFSDCNTCGGGDQSGGGPGSGTDYTFGAENDSIKGWPRLLKVGSHPHPPVFTLCRGTRRQH